MIIQARMTTEEARITRKEVLVTESFGVLPRAGSGNFDTGSVGVG